MESGPSVYQRYQPWRRSVEIGFWVFSYLVGAIGNSLTANMDVRRLHLDFSAWQPVVWETSSAAVSLALVPAMVWFTRRFPLHLDDWRRLLPLHLLGSLAWSILHVVGMVAIRKAVIPVVAGRNIAVLVEAAVRNTILQLRGIDTYQEFVQRQRAAMLRDD